MPRDHFLRYASAVNLAYDSISNALIQFHDDEIHIWELQSTASRYLGEYDIPERDPIKTIAISPDGRYLATGTVSDTIIWELDIDE